MGSQAEEKFLEEPNGDEGDGDAGEASGCEDDRDVAQDEAEDGNGRSAEGETNAKFSAALGDEVTESAVESDHGEEKSESAEEGGESGEETFLDEGVIDLLRKRGKVERNGL